MAAARANVPAAYWQSAFARDGGLLSYGVELVDTLSIASLEQANQYQAIRDTIAVASAN